MIDLHCHILPGLDDGPATLEETLRMARFCVDDGITSIVATPHCHKYVHLLRSDILEPVKQLNLDLKKAGLLLDILPGSEIQVTDSKEYRREFEADVFCHLGDGKDFTLLEFNWNRDQLPPDAVELVKWIVAQKMTPILAHPERFAFFETEPALLEAMVDAGAWVQITVDSILGNHGLLPKVMGEAHLKAFPNAVLATDAHNRIRCSGLSSGYTWVRKHLSPARAEDLRARADLIKASLIKKV